MMDLGQLKPWKNGGRKSGVDDSDAAGGTLRFSGFRDLRLDTSHSY